MQARPVAIAGVAEADIQGVKVRRNLLDSETGRLLGMARRLGKRLAYQIDRLDESLVPDQDWTRCLDSYGRIVLSLLREQRERAKLGATTGAPVIDDETFEEELKNLALTAIKQMPQAKLKELLAQRPVSDQDKELGW